ncbi:LysR family transcriptional regulator [Pseudomonas gingeri]|uniref:LysR family transcriptional regulator n=1 Tax=Pseudomonas gingeri TaxID=117681 RepID=A0A7Y7XI10_9PSED|nr:LysR family transcriptional regulator [Pseudomonas gingeri]NWC00031.1 LysR family transcriptional regulator [Pseudomonas gingeri]NWD70035.1 LysR family transcriptional regulator [Pseudomonas gingeri]
MNKSDPSWELYRSFLQVLREGSLSGAARVLGMTQPTVGRHIERIEESIGATLFIRTQQGLSPTHMALALQPYAEAMEATSAALLRVASSEGEEVRGSVRITASDIIAVEVLPPILAQLHAAHPGLVIELVPSNRMQDLLLREADIAVRMLPPSQDVLVARRIGSIELGLFGHRSYLDRRPPITRVEALKDHALIGYDKETLSLRALLAQAPWLSEVNLALRSDSDLALLGALRAGFGLSLCQVPLAQRDANLIRLLPEKISLWLDTWLVMHEDLRDSPRYRVTFAALVEGLSSYIGA